MHLPLFMYMSSPLQPLRYPEAFKAEDTWCDLGEPTTTIEKFAKTCSSCGAATSPT
jgi:hypothetical protein